MFRRFLVPLLTFALLAVAIAGAPTAAGQNNSLADVVRAAQSKRVVLDGIGDSTYARTGLGWGQGFQDAITGSAQCAGILIPPNHAFGTSDTHGMAFVRRRANGATFYGPIVGEEFGSPGYPGGHKQYGPTVPTLGIDSPLTTTLNANIASAGATSIAVDLNERLADPANAYTAYLQIDNEIIGYTDLPGTAGSPLTGVQTITGCTRGLYGTTATTHTAGATIYRRMAWEGPVSLYMGVCTLTADIPDGASTADFTVDSTAGFLNAGTLRMPGGELVTYTGKTATTFTGISRDLFNLVTQTGHLTGASIVQNQYPAIVAGIMSPDHPFGINTAVKNVMFTKSLFATSLNQAEIFTEATTTATFLNTDTTHTLLAQGTPTVVTGTAIGTLGKIIQTIAAPASDRGAVTLSFGNAFRSGATNFQRSMNGGCVVMFNGIFGTDRPVGFVQNMGTSRGGFTLNTFHRTMNFWDTTNDLCELRTGMIERYKVYRSVGDADVGGNGGAALAHLTVFGHNEVGGQGYAGLYQPGYPWTESPLASVGLLSNSPGVAGTTIQVDNGSSLRATKGSLYIFDGVSAFEYITYETATVISGTNYELANCARGQFGTEPIDLSVGMEVRQGYLQVNPKGFASDVLFDYLFRRDCWVAAGGSTDDFFYIYLRPIPTSASPEYTSHDLAANTTDALREGRLREYTTAIETYCGSLPGFIVLDLADIIGGDEAVTNDDGSGSSDNIHHTRSAYRKYAQRVVMHFAFGQGAGANPVAGVDGVVNTRGGLRGRPRRTKNGLRAKYRMRNLVKRKRVRT
jgi:hypothetical protein